MKLVRILSTIGIILGSILVLSSSYLIFKDNSSRDTSLEEGINREIESITEIFEEEIHSAEVEEANYELKESGWIPNWAFDLGYESLVNNKEIIDITNPVLYTIDSRGRVTSRGVSENNIQKLLTYTSDNNISVMPTIGSYDYESMHNLLLSETSRETAIQTIITDINMYGFDGIDLDFEKIYSSDKDNYLRFLKSLNRELDRSNKVLSITVFPQWNTNTYPEEQKETILAQDYKEIGDIADQIKIMAYDYTLQTSQIPGPIAPINWIRQVLEYSIKYVPKEKIWLGIHLYSYEWVSNKTVALTYTSVSNILNNPNINGTFREDIAEGYAEFGCEGSNRCVMYYQDKQGVDARRDLAKEYEIAGVSYWRLGGEMELLK